MAAKYSGEGCDTAFIHHSLSLPSYTYVSLFQARSPSELALNRVLFSCVFRHIKSRMWRACSRHNINHASRSPSPPYPGWHFSLIQGTRVHAPSPIASSLSIILPAPWPSHSHRVHHIPRTRFQHTAIHHPRALAFKLPSSRKPRRRRFMKTSAGLPFRNCIDERDVDERDVRHVEFNGNRRRGELIFVTLVVPVVSVRIPHSLKPSSYVRIPVLVRIFAPAHRSFC